MVTADPLVWAILPSHGCSARLYMWSFLAPWQLLPSDGPCGSYSNKPDSHHYFRIATILPETVFRVSFEQRRRTLKFRTNFARYAPEPNSGFDNGIGRASSLEPAVIRSLIGKSAQSSASAQHFDGAGPVNVDGMLFVNSGYPRFGGMPGNVLLAFSLDSK